MLYLSGLRVAGKDQDHEDSKDRGRDQLSQAGLIRASARLPLDQCHYVNYVVSVMGNKYAIGHRASA